MQSDLVSLRDLVRQFADERDWDKFHTPKNLATALSVEASELLEPFQWLPSVYSNTCGWVASDLTNGAASRNRSAISSTRLSNWAGSADFRLGNFPRTPRPETVTIRRGRRDE